MKRSAMVPSRATNMPLLKAGQADIDQVRVPDLTDWRARLRFPRGWGLGSMPISGSAFAPVGPAHTVQRCK